MNFPMRGQEMACPRIAAPLITYIGTNGYSPNFLAIGSSAPCLFREPARAAVSHFSASLHPFGHDREAQEPQVWGRS